MRAVRALTSSSTTRILPFVLTGRRAPLAVGIDVISAAASMVPPGGLLGDQGHPGPLLPTSATVGPPGTGHFRGIPPSQPQSLRPPPPSPQNLRESLRGASRG